MSPLALVRYTDRIATWYDAIKRGFTGTQSLAAEVLTTLVEDPAFNDPALLETLIRPTRKFAETHTAQNYASSMLSGMLLSLNRYIRSTTGKRDVEEYAQWVNTQTTPPWRALLHPLFAELYTPFRGRPNPPSPLIYTIDVITLGDNEIGDWQETGTLDASVYAGGYGSIIALNEAGARTIEMTAQWRRVTGEIVSANLNLEFDYVSSDPDDGLRMGRDWQPPFADALLVRIIALTSNQPVRVNLLGLPVRG